MDLIELLEPGVEEFSKCENFVVFEPVSIRVPESDILYQGAEILEVFDKVVNTEIYEEGLKKKIFANKISRIHTMLQLSANIENIVVTKFIKKIWKRYPFYSNLGELFLDGDEFHAVFPESKADFDQYLIRGSALDMDIELDVDEDEDKSDEDESKDDSSKSE